MALPSSGPLSLSMIAEELGLPLSNLSLQACFDAANNTIDKGHPLEIHRFYGYTHVVKTYVYFDVVVSQQGGGGAGGWVQAGTPIDTNLYIGITVHGDLGSTALAQAYIGYGGDYGEWNYEFPNGELITFAEINSFSPAESDTQIYSA